MNPWLLQWRLMAKVIRSLPNASLRTTLGSCELHSLPACRYGISVSHRKVTILLHANFLAWQLTLLSGVCSLSPSKSLQRMLSTFHSPPCAQIAGWSSTVYGQLVTNDKRWYISCHIVVHLRVKLFKHDHWECSCPFTTTAVPWIIECLDASKQCCLQLIWDMGVHIYAPVTKPKWTNCRI